MNQKLKNVFNCIKNANADALVSLSRVNHRWLLEKLDPDFALVLYYQNKAHVFVDAREFSIVKRIGGEIVAHLCQEPKDWFDFCKKIKNKKVLFESNQVSYDQYRQFIKPLKCKLISIDGNELRICKTPNEIQLIKKACQIICEAIQHIKKWIKVGVTEIQVADEIYRFVLTKGATGMSFNTIVGFGVNSADIHGVPSTKRLSKNDLILIDAGCIYHGYCSDITRVFTMGKLSSRLEKMYNVVLNSNKLGIEKIKPNMGGKEIDGICRNYIKQHWSNYDFPHGTGHGVGMLIHELPSNKKIYDKPIPSGSVVTIEPGIYEEGIGH